MLGVQWYMAATYVGAVVGAGFASGQEALTFFITYGARGCLGILITIVGFVAMGALNFALAQELADGSYGRILEITCGASWAKYYDIVITCFLLAGVGVMLAGAGSLVFQQWGLPPFFGVVFTACVAGFSSMGGIKGVFWVNALLVPGIFISTVGLGIRGLAQLWTMIQYSEANVLWGTYPTPLVPNWWLAGIVYLAYNSMLGIAACIPLAAGLPTRRHALLGGIVGGVVLGILLLASSFAIWGEGLAATESPLPMAMIATRAHPLMGSLYGIIIWSAMITTAATNLFAVTKRLGTTPGLATGGLLAIAFILSLMGFSSLIGLLYPFFGYLGGLYVAQTLLYFARRWWFQVLGKDR